MRKLLLPLAASLALSGLILGAGAASAAKPPYDPNIARVANPANACKSIPGTIEFDAALFGMPTPDLSWFSYQDCVETLARGEANRPRWEPFDAGPADPRTPTAPR